MIEPLLDLPPERRPLRVRLAWMLLIWVLSVAALGLVAYAIRWWIG